MTGREFYEKVQDHSELTWLGVAENGMIVVEHNRLGGKYLLPLEAIQANPWQELEDLFLGKREAQLMIQRTRIVGYYSRISQWNKSKLAELADRHKGKYALPAKTPDMEQHLPNEVLEILAAGGNDMTCKIPQLVEAA